MELEKLPTTISFKKETSKKGYYKEKEKSLTLMELNTLEVSKTTSTMEKELCKPTTTSKSLENGFKEKSLKEKSLSPTNTFTKDKS